MRKHLKFLPLIISALLLGASLAYFSGCTTFLTSLFEPTPTYTLTINGEEVLVRLPKDFPNMDKAIPGREYCWDAKLCVTLFCLGKDIGHDHVRIFYSDKDVVALGWQNIDGDGPKFWLYAKGVSMEVSYEKLTEALDSIWRKIPKQ